MERLLIFVERPLIFVERLLVIVERPLIFVERLLVIVYLFTLFCRFAFFCYLCNRKLE